MRVIDGTIHIKYVQPHSNVQFKRSRVAIRARQQALFALVFHLSVGVAGLVERYRPCPVVQIIGAVFALQRAGSRPGRVHLPRDGLGNRCRHAELEDE